MLKFKSPEIQEEFWLKIVKPSLQIVALLLARFVHNEIGKDLIVTDVLRKPGPKPSAHPMGRAFDFRANGNYFTPEEEMRISTFLNLNFPRDDGLEIFKFHEGQEGNPETYHGHLQVDPDCWFEYHPSALKKQEE